MSTLISAAAHINIAFVTFKMSHGLFWGRVIELSVIDCGRRRAWDYHVQQETAFSVQLAFDEMALCVCVCIRINT